MRRLDKSPWTDATRCQLRELWSEGHSTAEIGRRMGIGKDAVIGQVHRLNLPARPSPIRTRNPGDPVKPKIKRAPRVTLPAVNAEPAAPAIRAPNGKSRPDRRTPVARVVPHGQHWLPIKGATLPSSAPEPQPVAPVYAGRITECAYIVKGEGRTAVYCNEPTLPNRPMCGPHHQICFHPAPGRSGNNPNGNPTFVRQAIKGGGGSVIHPATLEEI